MELKQAKGMEGLYLVIDPSVGEKEVLSKLKMALQNKVGSIQILDSFHGEPSLDFIRSVCRLGQAKEVPVLINNRWDYLEKTDLDGVHFDEIPTDLDDIRKRIGRPFLCGITCENDLSRVQWAQDHGLDYISFCSVFPSRTQNSCELVRPEIIQEAIEKFPIPVFLAGGITPDNLKELDHLNYNGIAVVSGIMSSDRPDLEISKYQNTLNPRK